MMLDNQRMKTSADDPGGQPPSQDRIATLSITIALAIGTISIVLFASSETFIAAQQATFDAMTVMAEVCRL